MIKSKGFALIELIISIAILLLFSGISLAYYNDFTAKKNLELGTRRIVDVLDYAKQVAQTAAVDNTCTYFSGAQVLITASTITLQKCCNTNTACSSPTDLQTYNLPQNVQVISGTGTVHFQQFGQATSSTTNQVIQLKGTTITGNQCMVITITPFGLITADYIKVACT